MRLTAWIAGVSLIDLRLGKEPFLTAVLIGCMMCDVELESLSLRVTVDHFVGCAMLISEPHFISLPQCMSSLTRSSPSSHGTNRA